VTDHADLVLLDAVVALTERRVQVPAADAFERASGRPLTERDWVALRRSILRLERDGLVRSDREHRLEATDEGRALLQPRNSR
jgi:hypothetical protein